MPLDGVTLGFMARELDSTLAGGRVDKITQPEKDELQLLIRNHNENHLLLLSASASNARVHLTEQKKLSPMEPPMFLMLMRKHVGGNRVLSVTQYGGDRILEIAFEGTDELGDRVVKTLICEIMGKHSNLILVNAAGKIIDSVKHVTEEISRVRDVLPGLLYERPPAQDKLPYDALTQSSLRERLATQTGSLAKAFSLAVTGLSPQTAKELALRSAGGEELSVEDCDLFSTVEKAAAFLSALPALSDPALLTAPDGAPVDFAAFHYISKALTYVKMPTLSAAMDAFYRSRDQYDRIKQKSSSLYRVLKNNIERCEKKLALQYVALEDSDRMEEYRIKGELLTASAHLAKKGQKKALLPNYYDPECAPIEIALDEKLSPSQNAQRYFKLYQKARSAQNLAAEQIEKTEEELIYLEGQFDNLQKCEEEAELVEIRQELEKFGYVRSNHNRREMKKLPPSKPYHFVSSTGVDILVGKNNLQNDKLTQTANPNEFWLHAKDMPGSHVIVASELPDEQTLYEAALLAAYYSKGRASSQVPVDMTLRKYVKKPSGAKPGFVIYTHQRTVFVTPREEEVKRLTPDNN